MPSGYKDVGDGQRAGPEHQPLLATVHAIDGAIAVRLADELDRAKRVDHVQGPQRSKSIIMMFFAIRIVGSLDHMRLL